MITGRVQGVGYRFWAERAAVALGIRGWVRNRSDGSVELLATGSEEAVTALVEACRQGPRAASVTGVTAEDAADDGSTGFSARPTV
jgi:acylphosphatase